MNIANINDIAKLKKKHPAIFLMGPTAVGKSAFALQLAEKLPIEIISVDSAMVYCGMDIGTGKPTQAEREKVPHHLIDIRDPSETYSAAEFARDALTKMSDITARGNIPVLVGGTFLYFRALQQGLSALPSSDPIIRARLLEVAVKEGWPALHQRLAKIDPVAAKRIHPNDAQRIQRALEVYEISGRPMSSFFPPHPNPLPLGGEGIEGKTLPQGGEGNGKKTFSHGEEGSGKETLPHEGEGNGDVNLPQGESVGAGLCVVPQISDYEIKSFALMPTIRLELHQKIERRFHQMLEQGLVQEVEDLFNRGDLNVDMPSIRAVGYRQVWMYLKKTYSYDQMVFKAVAATRQLAKRQLTWLRSLSDIHTLQNSGSASFETVIHCVFRKGK